MGGDIALRGNRLFCIVLVTAKLPAKDQTYLKLINYLIMAIFLLGMVGYGFWLTYTTRLRTFQGIPGVSYSWATLSVPVGCLMMLNTTIQKIIGIMKQIKEKVFIQNEETFSEVI